MHSSIVLQPCDPNQAARLVAAMADRAGISYLRTSRGASPTLYGPDEEFPIGAARRRARRRRRHAGGLRRHRPRGAARGRAARSGRRHRCARARPPLDQADRSEALWAAASETAGIVVAEDHWPEGGPGEAILSALAAEASGRL